MLFRSLLLLFALIVGAAVPAAAQDAMADLRPVELRTGSDGDDIVSHIGYATGLPTLERIPVGQLLAAPMARVPGPTIHFGPPGKKVTLALRVRNAGAGQGSWIFTTGRGSLTYFRLYEVAGDRLHLIVDGTDPVSARENLQTYQAFSTELILNAGQEKLFVVDFLSENSTYMPIRIDTYGSFFKDRRANIALVSGVIFGVIILIFLNFLFFSITGHREFLWLAVAQYFFAVNTVHAEGYLTIFFLFDKPLVSVAIEDMFKSGFAAAMAQFGRDFINTRALFPRSDRALRVLIWSALVTMALQFGLALYPPALVGLLHAAAWVITIFVALLLPVVGYAAMRQLGRQLWPLFVGWASLAVFIVYAAVASMGLFTWLPINWHLAGPVGLFESIMVTLALGLNLKKIQDDKLAADRNYARSMTERLAISERAARLAEEKAFALATVNSQNALLHASGHDSKQVILALNSAVDALKRGGDGDTNRELTAMLQSSANYLSEIVSTTMSGANIAGSESDFLAISAFRGGALVEPLVMMFKAPFAAKKLSLTAEVEGDFTLFSDKPLLMRALANLLSNSYKYTEAGSTRIAVRRAGAAAVIDIVDTGIGMSADMVRSLNDDAAMRLRASEDVQGSGSGFRAARRLVGNLGGSVVIAASNAGGTTVRVTLPLAVADLSPSSAPDLQAQLPGWVLLDFDQRDAFDEGLARAKVPRERIAAVTYDDTTVTRGRLSEVVGMMLIKPLHDEVARHPLIGGASE